MLRKDEIEENNKWVLNTEIKTWYASLNELLFVIQKI